MKTFQIVTLFALIATSMAFSPAQVPQGEFAIQNRKGCLRDRFSMMKRRWGCCAATLGIGRSV